MLILLVFFSVLQESDNLWWDAFATEFFEDDATLTLSFCLEDGPKRYSKYHHSHLVFVQGRNLGIMCKSGKTSERSGEVTFTVRYRR